MQKGRKEGTEKEGKRKTSCANRNVTWLSLPLLKADGDGPKELSEYITCFTLKLQSFVPSCMKQIAANNVCRGLYSVVVGIFLLNVL